MRRLIVVLLLAACSSVPRADDASVRRAALEASLVSKTNGYARIRLAHYATGKDGDWDRLPEWNPPVEQVMASELDSGASDALGGNARALDVVAKDLRALGEEAFFRYPVQSAPAAVALKSRAAAKAYGVWTDELAGGFVRSEKGFAYTCSTCHAQGRSTPGLPNSALDVGGMIADSGNPDAAHKAALYAWGPGRLDVTTYDGTEPVRIPDLRPTRFQNHLHATASVTLNDVQSLAIRLETLIIVANSQTFRPPRQVALGLATYLFSLGDALPLRTELTDSETKGKAIFDSKCSGCHAPPNFTGKPVPLEVIGTDPRVGMSLDRGTGTYRVPSLRGVGTRGPLLHDASAPSLEGMFDPQRKTPGHAFGLDLGAIDRDDLIAYLRTL